MKVVLQDGIKDCGICSLLSIIRYYGGDVSKEYLREITNTTKDGVSAYNLIEGAKKIGFTASGMMGDLKKIENDNLPCLSHLIVNKNYKHFVTLYSINNKNVTIMDPAKGKRVLSIAEFKLLSSNYYIFLKPLKKLPIMNKQRVINKCIVDFIKNNRFLCLILSILTLIYFILNVITAFHLKYILEFSININNSINIFFISYNLLLIYLLKSCCNFIRNILLRKLLSVFDSKITFKTFEQILLLPYLYYKNRTTGEVITRLKDLNIIKSFISNILCFLMTDFISLIIFFFFMISINEKLTKYVVLFSLLLLIINILKSKKDRKLFKNVCVREENVNSYLIESLSNVDTIKGGHLEKRLIDTFLFKYKNLLESNYNYHIFLDIFFLFKQFINNLLLIIIYGVGAYQVIKGNIKLSELFIYQSFYSYFMDSINNILVLVDSYYSFRVATDRINEIYSISCEKFSGSYYYYAYDLMGSINIHNLSLKMGTKTLFNNLDMTINKGEKILLIGKSGSGKSTLVKMLLRYIEVPFGCININNIDISHYHLENLRKNITYVSSNEYLFTDTLYNNITLHKEYNEEEVFSVSKLCYIDEFINDDISKIMVEENGINFSNGERQRIILARCLLRKSNIYIFDEALGQIDTEKEKFILENIFKKFSDKIIIVISHRFNNSNLFDRVLELENGVINEKEKV